MVEDGIIKLIAASKAIDVLLVTPTCFFFAIKPLMPSSNL